MWSKFLFFVTCSTAKIIKNRVGRFFTLNVVQEFAILMKLNTYNDVFSWMNHNYYHWLGISMVMQINIKLIKYLSVYGQYIRGITKPTSLP